ncbi:MAG: acetyl-CoA carboxylase carboxyltransferase subunit alpha [Nitrospirae bacterium]|nr:acetyl-CoA carboxylase carboxyltransferase subunit alpha [Nitrospirota bacterium]
MIRYYLEFEKPIEELELKIDEMKRLSDGKDINLSGEIKKLEKKVRDVRTELYANLTPWQKTLLARHQDRPYTLDYIGLMTEEFIELHGDRRFADDKAIVGGLATLKGGIPAVIIGHQKGRGTKERIHRNFGQPHPEGYRKAMRLMELAEKFKRPIITLIDTPGAYPGIGAEERGQGEAIATNLMRMSRLRTPIVAVVIGEGGSGGALALSVADRLYMLEHSVYSVISPEGCAAILWKKGNDLGPEDFARASDALKMTAQDLYRFKIIDEIILEPTGGAHRDPEETAIGGLAKILESLEELKTKAPGKLIEDRYRRLKRIGSFTEEAAASSE